MTIFFTADTHFGHEKAINYHSNDKKIRPWNSVNDQDRELINNWNSVVGVNDLVYHIGDAYDLSVDNIADCMTQLNGKKILLKGNLDTGDDEDYLKYFDQVHEHLIIDLNSTKVLLTHYPQNIEKLKQHGCSLNIHGHLHTDCIEDPRYFCVSLERTNFSPISKENLLVALKEHQLKYVKKFKS